MSKCPQQGRVWVFAAVAILVGAAMAGAGVADFTWDAQVMPETVGTPRDPGERMAEMSALQQRLVAGQVTTGLQKAAEVRLTAADRAAIDDTSRMERKYLVGVTKPIGVTVDFRAARNAAKKPVPLSLGAARGTGDGGFVWTAAVRSPGATAMRLRLTGVDLPAGAELYAYNLAGHAFGPYTGRGPAGDGVVYTNTVFGEQILVQLRVPAGAGLPKLRVAEAGVMGARFVAPRYGPEGVFSLDDLDALAKASNLCSYNEDCVVNAACESSTPVNGAKDAVAGMLFQSGASWYICTGGLIADSNSGSVIPYFLTAHHCISSSGEAASLETFFDYTTTCSNPNCTQPYNNTGETVGSTIKATGSTGDYSLLQLSSNPTSPDGVVTYLGWSTTAVANTHGTPLYRISHPSGAPQAYSEGTVNTNKGTCRTLPRGTFIYSTDVIGATEGGSSGSPVVNGSGQVVGQLYGACGTDVNNVCNSTANSTVDGAFAAYYSNVSSFLAGGGGGGTCSAAGASCTSNSQCCSNSCKGKPGAKTCK